MSNLIEWCTGSGLINLNVQLDDALDAHHSGQCDDDVAALSNQPYVAEQLAKIDRALLAKELKEYGAWDDEDLRDHAQNLQRLLWVACGDIMDSNV